MIMVQGFREHAPARDQQAGQGCRGQILPVRPQADAPGLQPGPVCGNGRAGDVAREAAKHQQLGNGASR
jgi:hypothetical protein